MVNKKCVKKKMVNKKCVKKKLVSRLIKVLVLL
jgi:hypothetical protein